MFCVASVELWVSELEEPRNLKPDSPLGVQRQRPQMDSIMLVQCGTLCVYIVGNCKFPAVITASLASVIKQGYK